ncbi:unnamed protein product [Adineta ricciae]|uniref:Uncharacterized protein n=1 Tax=Adineta ricciae TaxID=249248 RepID=A0A814QQ65_ADIRI|nr:unnamed protein product [Adineta ricciae]CAF1191864.1 unnamed protein product [Adineta ricciae]
MSLDQQIQRESERFQILFNRLSETKWSETAIPEAQSRLLASQEQARRVQDKINAFNSAADKEHKRLLDIKGHGVRHAWYKVRGTLEQRVDEQEKVWLKEFEKCKEEEEHLTILKDEIQSAQTFLHQCQSAYDEYVKSKRALDGLLEHFFSGKTPSYPDEDRMEQNLRNQEKHLVNLQNHQRLLAHVVQLLQRAHQAVAISRQALNEALNMNTFDMFSSSSFADMAVSSCLAKARNAAAQAQQLLNEARRLYPNIPHIGELYIKQDNLVFNIMFDNIFTDLHMRQTIQEAMHRITRAEGMLTGILMAMKEQLGRCEAECFQKSNEVKRLATEHFTTRVTIVKNIIEPPPPYQS